MKKFKSVFSLLVAMAMIISVAPGVMAEDIAPITAEDIERYALGNADGRLIEEGMTVSYGNGTEMTSAPYIVDGFHYSPVELTSLKATALTCEVSEGVTISNDTLDLNTSTGEDNVVVLERTKASTTVGLNAVVEKTGVVSLTEDNNTIEFGWAEAKDVCRLEMWVHPVGAVKGYKIQYFDGANWIDHAKGELDQAQTSAADSVESKSTTAYIMTFSSVTTTKLRFVATSFKEGVTAAKIAEVVPRSNNNVNLLADNTLNIRGTSYAWLNGIGTSNEGLKNSGSNTKSSPYAYGFEVSGASASTQYWTYRYSASTFFSAYGYNPDTSIYAVPLEGRGLFYGVRFPEALHKISKVKFAINKGTVKAFEIWYGNDAALGNMTGWKKATTVTGNFEAGSTATAYISEGVAAECWKIVVTDYTEDTQISAPGMYVLGSYVSLIGDGASIGGGKTESILTDGFYYTSYEINKDNPNPIDYRSFKNLDKVVKFTQENSGIEFANEAGISAKRLDLWMLNIGGIKEYAVEEWDEEANDWKLIQNGEFEGYSAESVEPEDDTEASKVEQKVKTRASYYPIIFNRPVKTSKLRLVIKSFFNENGAYVSEALLRNSNDIDLGARGLLNNTGSFKSFSPYLQGYNMSGSGGNTDASSAHSSQYYGQTWYIYSSGSAATLSKDTADKNPDSPYVDSIWYATNFFRSRVKINKVGINVASGTITQFEVWAAKEENLTDYWSSGNDAVFPAEQAPDKWTKLATVDCNLTSSSTDLFEIPRIEEGYCSYIIRIPDGKFSPADAQINGFKFYSVADYELTPIAPCDAKVEGTVAPNEELQFSVFSCNKSIPEAKVFFALYSNDSLADVKIADCAISGAKTHTAKYTVPEEATGTLSLKAFLWDGVTLKPILSSFVEPEEVE